MDRDRGVVDLTSALSVWNGLGRGRLPLSAWTGRPAVSSDYKLLTHSAHPRLHGGHVVADRLVDAVLRLEKEDRATNSGEELLRYLESGGAEGLHEGFRLG